MGWQLRRLRKRIVNPEPAEARHSAVNDFANELLDHMAREEQLVFPLLLGISGRGAEEAVGILTEEHVGLRESIDRLRRAVQENSDERESLEEVRTRLTRHQSREERMLYPLFDRVCPEALRKVLAETFGRPKSTH